MSELSAAAAAKLARQLAELGEEFKRSVPARLAAIDAAVGALDGGRNPAALRELSQVAHRLAGAAGTFGHPALGAVAHEIEEVAKQLDGEAAAGVDAGRATFAPLLARLRAAASTPDAGDTVLALPEDPAPNCVGLVLADRRFGEELAEKLGQYGYQAITCTTPAELAAAVSGSAKRPDAIVFDLLAGDGLLDQPLLAETRQLAAVPVVIVSARDDVDARLQALRGGGAAFLGKPLDVAALVDRLDDLLDRTDHRPARVLIVEDDEITGNALIAVLASVGILAERVGDPAELLPRLQELLPDLVVMDMYLPGCRGDELVGVIRQIDAWQGVPIVYLSVEVDRDRQLQAIETGGDDFLQKPIAHEHLQRVVVARIERARRMRSLMTRDSLTGLLNHARFMEQLEIEGQRARRTGQPLSVAMIDIDHFKAVNDQYGHGAGDVVIKSLARLLLQRLRQVDVVGRYGGEEFAVVFPATGGAAARAVLEEIGRLFAAQRFRRPDGEFAVTFSAGVAAQAAHAEPRRLIDAADRALYDAKRRGRNRVELSTNLSGDVP